MHGDRSASIEPAAEQLKRPRKANECISEAKQSARPEKLFDEFWLEGELALLFGTPGTGKSVLAVQIADAIARGRGIDGFLMPAGHRKVLYVDLKLSDTQFLTRYSSQPEAGSRIRHYKFSEYLYRERPPSNDGLLEWLRETISRDGFRVVIIDDLSAIRQTYDGTRETLSLMRHLRRLKEEFGMSILVLTGSREPGRRGIVSEADMMRSQVLCDAADSVFAIGRHPRLSESQYLIQTRSRSAAVWNASNAPVCNFTRIDDSFLAFKFDERFDPEIDESLRQLICNVKWSHDAGATYRLIAKDFGISKTTAARLYKKWTPAMERDLVVEDYEGDQRGKSSEPEDGSAVLDEWEEAGFEKPVWQDACNSDDAPWELPESSPPYARSEVDAFRGRGGSLNVAAIPWAAALKRIAITDLKRGLDSYGREIFVESEDPNGKPMVWYKYDAQQKLHRSERKGRTIIVELVESESPRAP